MVAAVGQATGQAGSGAMRAIAAIYVWFEKAVAAVLLFGIGVVVVLAIESFGRTVFGTFAQLGGAPLDYAVFETLFDRILAALIAVELAHSVHQMVEGKHGLSQVRTVIVIGVLALVRKLIVLDVATTSGFFLLGLAAAILSLGGLLALVQWIETRDSAPTEGAKGLAAAEP
jgi:uncharacterized membrane protein (DUF373 family)